MRSNKFSLSAKLLAKRALAWSARLPGHVAVPVNRFAMRVIGVAERYRLPLGPLRPYRPDIKGFTIPPFDSSALAPFTDRLRTAGKAAAPMSSIVLLAFNKADYTLQCLVSLFRETDLTDTEVIVVDNASTDRTTEMLELFGDSIRVVRNSENLGFVGGCNSGAAVAKGKHLVFLNNDTVVLPDWLDALVRTVESRDDVGAVGSMFIYSDGVLQEAGSIVWNDGHAHHYGWGGSPDDKRYNFAREVDYCSGASLLIRRELFEQLGGFDQLYAPLYYEDTDLCFGVRSLGFKVLYQPMSRIIHFEGVTSGTDVTQGWKRFQVINHTKFLDKWRAVLTAENLEYSLDNVEAASNRKRRPIVLVFDERIPTPDRDAGSARMMAILKILTRSARTIFLPVFGKPTQAAEKLLWAEGIETAPITDFKRLLNAGPSAVVLSRPSVGELMIDKVKSSRHGDPRVIFDLVDAHFVRLRREYEVTAAPEARRQMDRYEQVETRVAGKADILWCNSSEDAKTLVPLVSGKQIEVIPTIHELKSRGNDVAKRTGLLFVGNLGHRPNTDGLLFFLNEILPLIRRELPDVKLTIVGDGATSEIKAFASDMIDIAGYVPNLEPQWASARVFVAPLRFGAGTKGKIGESLAHGLPVVTTSIGAEGMLGGDEHLLVGDDPSDFARCVVAAYNDEVLWQRIADAGCTYIAASATPDVIGIAIRRSIPALA